MKPPHRIVLAAAAAGLLLSGVTLARDNPNPDHPMIEKFDTNKDGKLDTTELNNMKKVKGELKAKHRAEMLAKFDADKDGKFNDAEREKMRQQKLAERFAELDKDKNGSLSLAEFQAMKRDHEGRGGFKRKHR